MNEENGTQTVNGEGRLDACGPRLGGGADFRKPELSARCGPLRRTSINLNNSAARSHHRRISISYNVGSEY